VRAERRGALRADHGGGFLDGTGVGFRADHARGDGDPGDTHRLQPGGAFLDTGTDVQRGRQHRQREPRGEQHSRDTRRAHRLGTADRRHDDAVGRRGDAEHAHPVGAGQAGVREPDVQGLGEQRVRVEHLGDGRVRPAGRDGIVDFPDGRRMRCRQQRHHDRRRGARRAAGRCFGEDRADALGIAAAGVVDLRQAHVEGGVVEAEDGPDLRRGAR
jgi:hypothetical protein